MLISPSFVAATSLRVLPRKGISRALGRIARATAPAPALRAAIAAYCRAYDVDLLDFEVPPGGFSSFDDFFTRRLKPGLRPLDADPGAVLSPADGRVEDVGPIELGSTLRVKGRDYTAAELLGDPHTASRYAGGVFAVVYLSPRDYHRVHAPVDGPVHALRHVPGTLFPVNAIGLRHVPKLFARNERVVVEQQSERHGPVASVMVGAIGVGRISVAFRRDLITNAGSQFGEAVYPDADAPLLQRGDELGAFHLGSTVIVFVGPSAGMAPAVRAGSGVRLGQALMRKRAVRVGA